MVKTNIKEVTERFDKDGRLLERVTWEENREECDCDMKAKGFTTTTRFCNQTDDCK